MRSFQLTALIAKVDTLQAENMRLRDQLERSRAQAIRDAEQLRVETNSAVTAARELAGERCEAAMSRLRLQAESLRKQNTQLSTQLSSQLSKHRELVSKLQSLKLDSARQLREERERLRSEADYQQRTFFGSLKTERDNLFEENELLKREICLATGESREALEEDLRQSLFSDSSWSLKCLSEVRKVRDAKALSSARAVNGPDAEDGLAPTEKVGRYAPPPPKEAALKYLGHIRSDLASLTSALSLLDEQGHSLEQGLLNLRAIGSSMGKADESSATSAVFKEAMRQAEQYREESERALAAQLDSKEKLERVSRDLERARRQTEELKAQLEEAKTGRGTEYDALAEENTKLISEKSEMEQKLCQAEDKISDLTVQLMDATEQLEAERARSSRIEGFSVRKSSSSDEVLSLNRKLEDTTMQLRRAQRELMQSRAEASRLQAEASQLRGRLAIWGGWN